MSCERLGETSVTSPHTAHAHASARLRASSETPKAAASSDQSSSVAAPLEKSETISSVMLSRLSICRIKPATREARWPAGPASLATISTRRSVDARPVLGFVLVTKVRKTTISPSFSSEQNETVCRRCARSSGHILSSFDAPLSSCGGTRSSAWVCCVCVTSLPFKAASLSSERLDCRLVRSLFAAVAPSAAAPSPGSVGIPGLSGPKSQKISGAAGERARRGAPSDISDNG